MSVTMQAKTTEMSLEPAPRSLPLVAAHTAAMREWAEQLVPRARAEALWNWMKSPLRGYFAPSMTDRRKGTPIMWGQHLALDVRACDRDKITDAAVLRAWVTELVDRIGMRAYGPPLVEHFASHDPKLCGFSVVQLIETSNVSGHFVDSNGDAYIDVFSCAPFDRDAVVAFVEETLRPEAIVVHELIRDARVSTSSDVSDAD